MRDDKNSKFGLMTPSNECFFIDHVWDDKLQQGDPCSIDLDAHSFAVSPDLGLPKRACSMRLICKTFGNMNRKVAYLIKIDPCNRHRDYMKERVSKVEKTWMEDYSSIKIALIEYRKCHVIICEKEIIIRRGKICRFCFDFEDTFVELISDNLDWFGILLCPYYLIFQLLHSTT